MKTTITPYFILAFLLIALSCTTKKTSEKSEEVVAPPKVEVKVPQQKLTKEEQIAAAVMAAPEEVRMDAKVYGYDSDSLFVTLREGTNDMICIADDPKKKGFEVVSYHKELEPFMARGRALKEEGKSFGDRRAIREEEAKSGKLKMPSKPATLHILQGANAWYDTDSLKVRNASYRYVVYIPFATQASTGLSLSPNAPGHPWLMFPGQANAHIMITPPEEETTNQ
tara:strand:+ start:208809 stop:209483 length:675 start_codon:yes stop_codon:yes gene_type:complete